MFVHHLGRRPTPTGQTWIYRRLNNKMKIGFIRYYFLELKSFNVKQFIIFTATEIHNVEVFFDLK